MTAVDLSAMVRRYWLVCLAVFLAVVASGVAAIMLPAQQYRSRAIVSVVPADKSSFDFGGTQIVQYLIPPVLTKVQSPVFENAVRRRLPSGLAGAPVEVTAQNDAGTGIIRLDVTSTSGEAARTAARLAVQDIAASPGSPLIRISALTPAGTAVSVRSERLPPILGGSIVLGLILAVLSAVAVSRLRPQLPRADTFRKRYGYEVLAEVPPVRSLPASPSLVFSPNGPVEIAAAFRSLEARVMMRLTTTGTPARPVIAVTSWGEGEGKSTIAANLAWALASLDHAVTLIDLDLRRPRLHSLFAAALDGGVADIARGAPVRPLRAKAGPANLRIIPAGRPKGLFAETVHLALPRLNELRDQIVVLDTPPMFTSETIEIVGWVDAVILVADARKRSPEEIEEALAELTLGGTPVLGVVLNRVETADGRGRSSYYYAANEA